MKDGTEAAYLTYRATADGWCIDHTVVEPAYRGRGLARVLVIAAADEAAVQNAALTAECDYAAAVLAERAGKQP